MQWGCGLKLAAGKMMESERAERAEGRRLEGGLAGVLLGERMVGMFERRVW